MFQVSNIAKQNCHTSKGLRIFTRVFHFSSEQCIAKQNCHTTKALKEFSQEFSKTMCGRKKGKRERKKKI